MWLQMFQLSIWIQEIVYNKQYSKNLVYIF